MIIAVDFDGTIVEHEYPVIGKPVKGALLTIHALIKAGHQIILYTMRSGFELDEAINYLKNEGIELYGINNNPNQHNWTKSPKAYAQLYIDDAALGCPLIRPLFKRPYADWETILVMLNSMGIV